MASLVLKIALVAAVFVQVAVATDHLVGSPDGSWDHFTNVKKWAASNKFVVGDTLTFVYPEMHNVYEVRRREFVRCNTSSPIMKDNSGNTVVQLKEVGKRYFVCGIPGHCALGMKMEIDITK